MRVVITGGTGLIGRAFCRLLVESGYEVWVVSRSAELNPPITGVKVARWDGMSAEGWGPLVDNAYAVVNLAGENIGARRWTPAIRKGIRISRIKVGEAVMTAIHQANIKPLVLIQASAVGYYGPLENKVATEDTAAGSDYLAQLCVEWEGSTRDAEAMDIRRVVIRTGLVLSTQGGALGKLLLPFRLYAGGPLGSGRQWWSWIHLEDQIQSMKYLMENVRARGVFNTTAPEPVTMNQFGNTLAEVLKRPYWMAVPSFALELLLGEMSTVILDGQHAVPQRLLEAGYPFIYRELKPALENLLAE
jgi:uncharacterized protein (TIGR01777 family)